MKLRQMLHVVKSEGTELAAMVAADFVEQNGLHAELQAALDEAKDLLDETHRESVAFLRKRAERAEEEAELGWPLVGRQEHFVSAQQYRQIQAKTAKLFARVKAAQKVLGVLKGRQS